MADDEPGVCVLSLSGTDGTSACLHVLFKEEDRKMSNNIIILR